MPPDLVKCYCKCKHITNPRRHLHGNFIRNSISIMQMLFSYPFAMNLITLIEIILFFSPSSTISQISYLSTPKNFAHFSPMTKYLPTQTNSDFCVVTGQTKTSIKNSFLARLYFFTSITKLPLFRIRLTKSVSAKLFKYSK